MINLGDDDDSCQQVIPRWMEYWKSIKVGELGLPAAVEKQSDLPPRLAAEIELFWKAPSPRVGGDIFERLLCLGETSRLQAFAQYVAGQRELSSVLRSVAGKMLGGSATFQEDSEVSRVKIAACRFALKNNPKNGIRWVELARMYLVVGQKDKAERALRIALNLNPYDRYTVRAAIRFYFHINSFKCAVSVLGRDLTKITDPWLKGVGLSALLWAEKLPIRKVEADVARLQGDSLFEYSELVEALGMLELSRDKMKPAQKLFRAAWQNPSGNVTTHAEWVTRNIFKDLRKEATSLEGKSPEANARYYFSERRWRDAFATAEEWILEEPYSKRPYRFLAVCYNVLMRFEDVLKTYERAKAIGFSDFRLRVSRLYALLCLKRLDEASEELESIVIDELKEDQRPVMFADMGMLFYLRGKLKEGEEYYLLAEKLAAAVSSEFKDDVFVNHLVAKRMAGANIKEVDVARLKKKRENIKDDVDLEVLIWRIDNGSDRPIVLEDRSKKIPLIR